MIEAVIEQRRHDLGGFEVGRVLPFPSHRSVGPFVFFAHHGPEDLPTYEFPGLWARLIAGEAFGARAAVKTHSPLFYVHWRLAAAAEVMLLGGESVGPQFVEWNFVSSSRDRIDEAKADWRAGRMKLPDLDHDEFIPLPPDPAPPANPMS